MLKELIEPTTHNLKILIKVIISNEGQNLPEYHKSINLGSKRTMERYSEITREEEKYKYKVIDSELLIPAIKNNNLHGFIRKIKSRDRSLEESPARDSPRRTGGQYSPVN